MSILNSLNISENRELYRLDYQIFSNLNNSLTDLSMDDIAVPLDYLLTDTLFHKCSTEQVCRDNLVVSDTCPLGSICTIRPCGLGKYADDYFETCLDCPEGKICSNGIIQETCGNGTYVNDEKSECNVCEDGFLCVNGLRQACPEAHVCLGNSKELCTDRTIPNENRTTCVSCPNIGSVCQGGILTGCTVGNYCEDGLDKGPCPTGFSCANGTLQSCPANHYCTDGIDKGECPADTMPNENQDDCQSIPINMTPIIIGCTIGGVVLLVLVVAAILFIRKKIRDKDLLDGMSPQDYVRNMGGGGIELQTDEEYQKSKLSRQMSKDDLNNNEYAVVGNNMVANSSYINVSMNRCRSTNVLLGTESCISVISTDDVLDYATLQQSSDGIHTSNYATLQQRSNVVDSSNHDTLQQSSDVVNSPNYATLQRNINMINSPDYVGNPYDAVNEKSFGDSPVDGANSSYDCVNEIEHQVTETELQDASLTINSETSCKKQNTIYIPVENNTVQYLSVENESDRAEPVTENENGYGCVDSEYDYQL
eukprot:Awhi_evm1s1563